jgi:RimJ/RimL family protein N-acetyltransferase
MDREQRWDVTWRTPDGDLRAYEPTTAELAVAAPTLATYYNDAYNRTMMNNTVAMTAAEIVEHFQSLRGAGGKPFLLERDGELAGDTDLRHLTAKTAEFAILIGRRPEQGKGLGTRFAVLLHAFAFLGLGLDRLYISIIPANLPSQRLFAKLGYQADTCPAARAFADHESDLTLSLGREVFLSAYAPAIAQIRWILRASGP